jgi:hypothetical protein
MSVFISQGHQFFLFGSQLPDRRLTGSYPETGLEEINGDLLEEDFWPREIASE